MQGLSVQPRGQLSSCSTVWVAPAHLLSHEFPGISTGSHMGVWQHHHGGLVSLTQTQHQHQPFGTSARFSGGSQTCQSVLDRSALALPTCQSCCFAGVFSWPLLTPSLPLPSFLLHISRLTTHPIPPGAEQHLYHSNSSRGNQAADQTRPQG